MAEQPNNEPQFENNTENLPPPLAKRFTIIKQKSSYLEYTQFHSKDFKQRLLAFLMVQSDSQYNIKKYFAEFCSDCKEHEPLSAEIILGKIVDTYVSPAFNVRIDILTSIGIALGINGFEALSLRCADRADELIELMK